MNELQEEFSEFGPSQHIHAIGMIVLHYNLLETWLQDLMIRYLPALPRESVRSIFQTLNNRQRVDLLKSLSAQEVDDESREIVVSILTSFDICAENRNLIAHAWPTFQHEEEDATIYLVKPPSKNPNTLEGYDFTLDDLHKAARASWDCGGALHDVVETPVGQKIALHSKFSKPKKAQLEPASQKSVDIPKQHRVTSRLVGRIEAGKPKSEAHGRCIW